MAKANKKERRLYKVRFTWLSDLGRLKAGYTNYWASTAKEAVKLAKKDDKAYPPPHPRRSYTATRIK